eukprot:2891037-Rhodomonas_salina.1
MEKQVWGAVGGACKDKLKVDEMELCAMRTVCDTDDDMVLCMCGTDVGPVLCDVWHRTACRRHSSSTRLPPSTRKLWSPLPSSPSFASGCPVEGMFRWRKFSVRGGGKRQKSVVMDGEEGGRKERRIAEDGTRETGERTAK